LFHVLHSTEQKLILHLHVLCFADRLGNDINLSPV
jgi:hypothetical protein